MKKLTVPDGWYPDGTPRPGIEVEEVLEFSGPFVRIKLANGITLTAPMYAVYLREVEQ